MANVLINEKYLNDIADAIRSKSGSSSTYKPKEMASAIESISVSSGSEISAADIFDGNYKNNWSSIELPNTVYLEPLFCMSDSLMYVNAPKAKYLNTSYSSTTLPTGTFDVCSHLKSFHSNEEIVHLGERAFAQCGELTDLGDSLYVVDKMTFKDCKKLERVNVYAFEYDLTTVPSYSGAEATAFTGSGVKVIDIRKRITGEVLLEAIANPILTSFILRDITGRTDIRTNRTYGTYSTGYIYVPSSLYNSYVTYADESVVERIRKIEEYPDICG